MKADIPVILRVSPSRQKAWRILEHIYSEGDYAPERNITTRIAQGHYKLAVGYPTHDPHFDALMLLARHHGKGKEARHLIFSTKEMPGATEEEYQHALAGVVATALDFLRKEAPGHDYILQPHTDRLHPHCHVTLCASNGCKCIDWKPKDLSRFQGLEFLQPETLQKFQLVPGRGRGKRPAGVGRVSYASAVSNSFHETKEKTLAKIIDYELILTAIQSGELEVTRRTKSGKPLSVSIDGKNIRLSTLRKAAAATASPDTGNDDTTPGGSPGVGCGTAPASGGAQRRSHRRPANRPKTLVRSR